MALEMVRAILTFVLRLFWRIEFYGEENIPEFGPVILIANHPSYTDPVAIHVGAPARPVRWMAWDAIFRVPFLGSLVKVFGAYPIDVESAPKEAFEKSLSLLRQGEVIGVFPEGGRSAQSLMGDAKTGAIRLAVRSGSPVVPVSVAGAFRAWPKIRRLPRPGRIGITYHPPIHFYSDRPDHKYYEQAMEQVKQTINHGLCETYAEWHLRRVYDPTMEEFGLLV